MNKEIIKNVLLNAFATAAYVFLIASFLFYIPHNLDSAGSVLMPIVMLLLLVFSVALVGSLIFGRPTLWYLEGKKKEAILLLAYTLAVFFLITVAVLLLLFFLV